MAYYLISALNFGVQASLNIEQIHHISPYVKYVIYNYQKDCADVQNILLINRVPDTLLIVIYGQKSI